MKKLVRRRPEIAIFRASLANTLWQLGNSETAEIEFREATKLEPDSEKISLRLFHFLLDGGRKEEALDEAKRFVGISESQEYENLISLLRH